MVSSKSSSVRSFRSPEVEEQASERSPLLPGSSQSPAPPTDTPAWSPRQSIRQRWPSIVALIVLFFAIIAVLAVGFFAPAAAQQYARQAAVMDISSLSIESFTGRGIEARVQGTVSIEARRVRGWAVRTFGRIGTRIARKVATKDFTVFVYLPDYNKELLGSAYLPGMVIDIRNGHSTPIDVLTEVEPGSADTIRRLADDYLQGELDAVNLLGEANLDLRSGVLPLGSQKVSQEITFREFPSIPQFSITKLKFGEIELPHETVVSANVSVVIENPYPLEFTIPSLPFTIAIPGCNTPDLLNMATATTSRVEVRPKSDIMIDVWGVIRKLPADLTTICPSTHTSPMDAFLGRYLHGNSSLLYITGGKSQVPDAPDWMLQLLRSLTVPIQFPGHAFDNIIQSFGLSHVAIELPPDDAEPGSPESAPRLSATVEAFVALPEEMNVPLDIKRLRAAANISFDGSPFGTLEMTQWMPARSSLTGDGTTLRVEADVDRAPLHITDYNTFGRVVRKMMFGNGKRLTLGIDGLTDADVSTGLGRFIVREIPGSGNITIKGFPGFGEVPKVKANDLVIEDTTSQSLTLKINVTVDNPTPWEAKVPYVNVLIVHGNMILGNVSVQNTHVRPGANNIIATGAWDPLYNGGQKAVRVGTDLISDLISGRNTTLTLRVHENSIPSLPELSAALSNIEVTVPTPHLSIGNPDDDVPLRFIESATMHVFSSTADFVIRNPLPKDIITIAKINAKAKYNGSELGTISYTSSFDIIPGREGTTLTPRLPVAWKLGGAAYDAMRKALGGRLEVHAEAMCNLFIGKLELVDVFYNSSHGILAHIRL